MAELESASMQLQQLKQQQQLYEDQKNAQENEINKLRKSKVGLCWLCCQNRTLLIRI